MKYIILVNFLSFSYSTLTAADAVNPPPTTTPAKAPTPKKAEKDYTTLTTDELLALPTPTLEREITNLKTKLTEAQKNLSTLQNSFKGKCQALQNKIQACPAQYNLDGVNPLNHFGCLSTGGNNATQTIQIAMMRGGNKSFILDTGDYISAPFTSGSTTVVFKPKNGTAINPKRFMDITTLDLRAVTINSKTGEAQPDERPAAEGLSIEFLINQKSIGKFSFIEPLDNSDFSKLIVNPTDILNLSRIPSCQ